MGVFLRMETRSSSGTERQDAAVLVEYQSGTKIKYSKWIMVDNNKMSKKVGKVLITAYLGQPSKRILMAIVGLGLQSLLRLAIC